MFGKLSQGPIQPLGIPGVYAILGYFAGNGASDPALAGLLGAGWSIKHQATGIYRVTTTKPWGTWLHGEASAYLNSDSNYTTYVRNLQPTLSQFDIEVRVAGTLTDLLTADACSFEVLASDSAQAKKYVT